MKPNPQSLNPTPSPKRYRWWRFIEHSLPVIVIYLMVATLVSFLIAPNVIVTVPTGHVGILWKRFRGGTQLDPRLLKDEGMRVLLPWDKLFLYDLRLQTHTDTYNAISKDGAYLTTTINIRFRLKHDAVPQLHQTIGPDYVKRMLSPEIGNRAREIFAEYSAEEIYSTKRQEIQKKIRTHTEAMLGQSSFSRTEQESEYGEHYKISLDEMLIIYDTLVLGLELPTAVNAAINRKIEQYYLVQEYAYRVEREKKESERKAIEANGIRDFQQTVTQGISDSYVRWRGIEATLQLAQSPNTKIVIIGSGKDGLPVILGNVDAPMQPNPAPAAPPGAAALPDNSEAARQRPAGASPPFVEKTPTSNLQSPVERPSPTGAPRATDATPNNAAGGAPNPQSGAPPGEPRTSWTWSEIQDLISRTIGSGTPAPETRPPTTGSGPGPGPSAGPSTGPGAGPGPGAAPAPPPAAGPLPPQAEGPPPPRPDRGSPRPPEQPRQ
jgi:regulator of protease activity HflC (stomatin/prohibitin superfamily)